MSEMTHEDAFAALTDAAAVDAAAEQAPEAPEAPSHDAPPAGAPVEPVQPEPVQAPEAPVAPEDTAAPELPVFNPDDLPEELLPAWQQLQAAWTPKLQAAAAIQKRFEELGGDNAVEQAVGLYQRISDPQSWPQLYEELYQAMEQAGFEFEDPNAVPGVPVAPTQLAQLSDDPELAPLIQQLQSLSAQTQSQQQQIQQFAQEQQLRQQIADAELEQAQYLASLQRQVVDIRNSNPAYTDDDVRAIIELGSFYNDDLALAQQRYESVIASRLNRYFAAKQAGAPASTQPLPGAGVLSESDKRPETMEDAENEAVELMRRLQAAGELDDI